MRKSAILCFNSDGKKPPRVKQAIAIFAIIILGAFLLVRSKQNQEIPKFHGSLKDLEENLSKLMGSNNDHAFLIIEISGTEDFIQFSGDDKGVQLDFPLVTDRQKEMEAQIRQSATKVAIGDGY